MTLSVSERNTEYAAGRIDSGGLANHSATTEPEPFQQSGGDNLAASARHGLGSPSGACDVIGNARDVTGLISDHLTLVAVLVAERLRKVPAHVRRDELMSAGMFALVVSARVYDSSRGVSFRRFAAFRIRGALIDDLRGMDWASRSVRSRARLMQTVRAHLTDTLDRPPGMKDVAGAMGITAREVGELHAELTRARVLSLEGSSVDSLPNIPARHRDCPESLILHREKLGYLHDAVAALPERLRFVVVAHFFGGRKMNDIASDMSVTQSRVSQLCTEAVALIRDGLNSELDPDTLRPLVRPGRDSVARTAYFKALANRNTLAGRLEMSSHRGEMRGGIPPALSKPEKTGTHPKIT